MDDGGQIVRRFLVHGSKVRLCHWSGKDEGEQELWRIRPGLLPDFPDSEVSVPLHQAAEHEDEERRIEEERRLEESVRSTRRLEVEDEALRTKFKDNTPKGEGPVWQECEDAIMDDAMSMSNNDSIGRVEEWLTQQHEQSNNDNYEEPMERGNHGASDQTAKERLWRLAQRQADKDGNPASKIRPTCQVRPLNDEESALNSVVTTEIK